MPWLQLKINCSRDNASAVELATTKAGALAVTLQDNADQPIFEPELGETPLWQETRITALFDASINTSKTLETIAKALPFNPDAHWAPLEDKDWEREWMQHFHPIQCAENFWICPSWIAAPDPQAINLKLDPGLAFGTGTHPTTYLCLQWLCKQALSDLSIADYGCGSGILGVAALLLGAKHVVGIDIDPQALISSRNNAQRNGIEAQRFPVYFPDKCPEDAYDVVLANILAGPLVDLAATLSDLVRPGGKICLSGILANQRGLVESAYKDNFKICEINEHEGWLCISGEKS